MKLDIAVNAVNKDRTQFTAEDSAAGNKISGEARGVDESSCAETSENALHEGDFYMDGPFMVFTAQYHLRRGYCCNSGCRHCPYAWR